MPLYILKKNPKNTFDSNHWNTFDFLNYQALAGVAQWIEHGLQTTGSLVRFPVRAQAWVGGQVSPHRGGHERGNHTLMFLYLSFSLPSSLSKNR